MPHPNAKKKKNIFQGTSSSSDKSDGEKSVEKGYTPNNKPSLNSGFNSKYEVIEGVFMTNKQLYQVLNKYGSEGKKKEDDDDKETIRELKNKYIDLCNVITE